MDPLMQALRPLPLYSGTKANDGSDNAHRFLRAMEQFRPVGVADDAFIQRLVAQLTGPAASWWLLGQQNLDADDPDRPLFDQARVNYDDFRRLFLRRWAVEKDSTQFSRLYKERKQRSDEDLRDFGLLLRTDLYARINIDVADGCRRAPLLTRADLANACGPAANYPAGPVRNLIERIHLIHQDPANVPAAGLQPADLDQVLVFLPFLLRFRDTRLVEHLTFIQAADILQRQAHRDVTRQFISREQHNVNSNFALLLNRAAENERRVMADSAHAPPRHHLAALEDVDSDTDLDEAIAALQARKAQKEGAKPKKAGGRRKQQPTPSGAGGGAAPKPGFCSVCKINGHTKEDCGYSKMCAEKGLTPIPYADRKAAKQAKRSARRGNAAAAVSDAAGVQQQQQQLLQPLLYDDTAAGLHFRMHPN